MEDDTTRLIESVEPLLIHLHGYTTCDMAVLHAISRHQNQTLLNHLAENDIPLDHPECKQAWCHVDPKRLAWDKGLSIRAVHKASARAKVDGLLLTDPRGANQVTWRCINTPALKCMGLSEDADALYEKYRSGTLEAASAVTYKNKIFAFDPIDWTEYIQNHNVKDPGLFPESTIAAIELRHPCNFEFRNFFERQIFIEWMDWIDGLRGTGYTYRFFINKDCKNRPRGPSVTISHPQATGQERPFNWATANAPNEDGEAA